MLSRGRSDGNSLDYRAMAILAARAGLHAIPAAQHQTTRSFYAAAS